MSHTCPYCHDVCFCDMDDTDLTFLGPPKGCDHECEEPADDDWDGLDDDEREAIITSPVPEGEATDDA